MAGPRSTNPVSIADNTETTRLLNGLLRRSVGH
jgi:hypothetical protein